jgi:putative ABC transport system permease protein
MLRAMLRDLRAHVGRVSMTLVAIVVGVAFVVATWVVSDTVAATITNGSTRSDLAARVTLQGEGGPGGRIVGSVGGSEPLGGPITEEVRRKLATVPGVTGATGVTIGYAALVRADGKVGDSEWPDENGTSWDSSQRFTLVDGQAPTGTGQVALEEGAAKDAGLEVGSSAKVLLAAGRSDTATVSGIYTYRTAGMEGTPTIAYAPATATSLLGPGYTSIELFGADQVAITAAAGTAAGPGFLVASGADLAAQAAAEAASASVQVKFFLLAFAGVALLVGMFVIANTFTMLVAQRTRFFALLRAVGARRRQVRRAVLGEAGVLGAVGAVLGVAAGIGLAAVVMAVLRQTGETILFTVSPVAIIVGLAVGVAVTMVSAWGSARRAAAVAPVAALRTDAVIPRRSLVLRTVFGFVAIALGATAVLATSAIHLTNGQRAVGMTGALLAWLGVLLLAPLLAAAVLRPLARIWGDRSGPAMRVALQNAIRDPRRTAATASALMIGVALVCAFATVSTSVESAFTGGIRDSMPARTFAITAALPGVDLDAAAVAKVKSVSEVDALAAPLETYGRFGRAESQSFGRVTGLEPDALGRVLTPPVVAGTADLVHGALLATDLAAELDLAVGDPLTIDLDGSILGPIPVTGIYERSEVLSGAIVNPSLLPAGSRTGLRTIYASGPDPAATRAALDKLFADRPDIRVSGRDQLIDEVARPIRLVLGVVSALLGAAILIAIFGVVNTLALSVLERTREIGVLRAVGASRRFVRRTVRGESVVIATYGGLLGVGVGLLLGGVMQHVLMDSLILDLTVPYQAVGVALVGMVLVGVVAALWPARRAAGTDVLTAIAVE